MNVKGGLRNAITEKRNEVSPVKAMGDLLKRMHTQIEKALPSVITPERFTRIALTAYSRNEKLQECTAESFLGSMMQAAQLGDVSLLEDSVDRFRYKGDSYQGPLIL